MGCVYRLPPFFFLDGFTGFYLPCYNDPHPKVVLIQFPGQHRQHWAGWQQPRAPSLGLAISGGTASLFSGILALPGGRPLGAHCHGNGVGMAAPNRRWRGLAPAVGFPTAPGS